MVLRRDVAHAVAQLQRAQIGLITVEQARAAGAYDGWLRKEVAAGRAVRVRRNVYASPTVAPTYEQALLAAVIASSSPTKVAAASHETAADLMQLPLPGNERPPFEITTALDRKPHVEGVRLHRSRHLTADHIWHVGPIPVTTASRTIVDLSMRLDGRSLGRLLDEALRRRMLTLGRLQRDASRLRVAPGRSVYRVLALVLARTGEDASESVLEEFAIDALVRFGIRLPTQQHPVRTRNGRKRRVDLCYAEQTKVIEALGYEYHGLRSRFDDDALRNNELVRAGYIPLFVTSAMTDWDVAALVAEAISEPVPPRPAHELTFSEWSRARGR